MRRKTLFKTSWRRVDVQVSFMTAGIVVFSSLCLALVAYQITYRDMLLSLQERVESIYAYIETQMDKTTFTAINTREDMTKPCYIETCQLFERIRGVTGVQYLYTAKRNAAGELVYIIDGLERSAPDIRYPGDPIEPEIQDALNRALAGEKILPDDITQTDWGEIFITYLPIHAEDNSGEVIGVIGIEFYAHRQYRTYQILRMLIPVVIILFCALSAVLALVFFRRISNPLFQDLSNTDYLTKLKNRNAYEVDIKNLCVMGKAAGMAIFLADLNGLKKMNDTMGHEAGDAYIKVMAQAMAQAKCGDEIIYRIGGDEFVTLMKNATDEKINQFIWNLGEQFAMCKVNLPLQTSYSIGYAICDGNDIKAFEDAYNRADKNMYQQKNLFYHQI